MIRSFLLNTTVSVALGLGAGASAVTIAERLEQAIYEEETVGNLDAAIEIYTNIVEETDAERAHVAQALYRLGQCQLKKGHDDLAAASFRKLVEHYPDQSGWTARARSYLPESPSPGVAIGPAPWKDGELLRLAVFSKRGDPLGDMTVSARSTTVDGSPAWLVEAFMGLPKVEVAKYVYVYAERDSFVPLRTKLYHSQLGTAVAEYVDGERRMMLNRPGKLAEPYNQKLGAVTYDNEQVLYLVRRLPLSVGYETTLLITGRPGVTATATVNVLGIESVTVPAGTFECFKVEVGSPPYIETEWFSTDANRYVVKVSSSEVDVALTEITRLPEGPHGFEEPATGISLTAPAGWDIQKSSFRFGEHEFFLMIFAPEMKIKAAAVAQRISEPMTVREFARVDTGIYKSRRDSYQVDPDSWTEMQVSGAPAVSLLATLQSENEQVREYRVYIAGPEHYYWFIYRARPDVFDSMKGGFDSIVDSLTFN
jgi:hypothetical protein